MSTAIATAASANDSARDSIAIGVTAIDTAITAREAIATAADIAAAANAAASAYASATDAVSLTSGHVHAAALCQEAASADALSTRNWGTLWPGAQQPYDLKKAWDSLRAGWLADDADWSFWIEWYQRILQGNPMEWDLIFQIAKGISDEDWKAGQARVAQRINEIRTSYLAQKTPLAETVSIDARTGLFRVDPIDVQNSPLIEALVSRIEDALDDAVQGNNGLNATSSEVRVLERATSKYANDPQRLELDFTSVAVGLRRQLNETHELPSSEDNVRLLETVEEAVRGLRANHPDVARNRTQLAQQNMHELPEEDLKKLGEYGHAVLEEISQGTLKDDFKSDIPKLVNDALLPLPSGAPPLPGADEATRIFGRASRMAELYHEAINNGAELFDSKIVKSIRLVGVAGGIGGFLYWLVGLGLRAFGVL